MIPDEKLEEVKAATDLVEVASDYVRLKKQGSRFIGLCPFHRERTPSFSVDPATNLYYCFGCQAGGDAITFVRETEGLGFEEAVRLLAGRAGIEIPQEGDPAERDETESILHALRFAARFYYHQLTQTEEGRERGLAYFRGRGFSNETITRFGLGYAPERWDALLAAAAEQHIPPETLEKAGLVIPRKAGGGHYDRFRGRVMFPILSHVGKVLGFGGRILGKTEGEPSAREQPKYINSPETRVYRKSRVLYGLFQARQAVRGAEEVLLVEGYTDVISLHQAGVENVVATSGTALTPEQVRALARYARRVLLLFDADAAGATAALRGIDLVLREGLAAYAVALPEGADPDAFVRRFGAEAFRNFAHKERQGFVRFHVEVARRAGRLATPEGQAEAASEVLRAVAQVPDPVAQDAYIQAAAEALGVPDITLRARFREIARETGREAAREARREARSGAAPEMRSEAAEAPAPPPARPAVRPEEEALIRLMLAHGAPMVEHVLGRMALSEFTEGPARATVEHLLRQYHEGQVVREPFVGGEYGEAVQRLAAGALADRHEVSANWERRAGIPVPERDEEPLEAAASAMTLLKLDRLAEAIERQHRRIYEAERAGEELGPLLAEMQQLQALRGRIERREFLQD